MASPYPLPPGCVFREDFRSAALAAQNGIVGSPTAWLPGGGVNLSTSNLTRPGLIVHRGTTFGAMTVVFDVIVTPADGNYHSMLNQYGSGSANEFSIGLSPNNSMYWSTASVTTSTPVATGRRLLYWTADGSIGRLYADGVLIGSRSSDSSVRRTNTVMSIGAYLGTQQRCKHPILQFRAYSYAMTAEEIAADYRTIRGLQA